MIRVTSTEPPFDTPEVMRSAVGVISTAEAMGLLAGMEIHRLDLASFREVMGRITSAGIGSEVQATLALPRGRVGSGEMSRLLERLASVLDESPVPSREWGSLTALFGVDRLAELLGVSPASVRRYMSGARSTPDSLAARLHLLAVITGDLAGAYNEIGIRRWFERPRTLLNGKAPEELLQGEWDPEDLGPKRLRELARSLTGSPAT